MSTLVVSALTLATAGTLLSTPASAAPTDTAVDAQVDAATADVLALAAEQSLETRAMAIVGTSTTKRSLGSLAGGRVAVDARLIAGEGTMADAIHAHRAWLRSVGEGYIGAETTLTAEAVERTGTVVTVDANEVTMLTYEKITGTEPSTTGTPPVIPSSPARTPPEPGS